MLPSAQRGHDVIRKYFPEWFPVTHSRESKNIWWIIKKNSNIKCVAHGVLWESWSLSRCSFSSLASSRYAVDPIFRDRTANIPITPAPFTEGEQWTSERTRPQVFAIFKMEDGGEQVGGLTLVFATLPSPGSHSCFRKKCINRCTVYVKFRKL